jgi:hypothetical protein
MYHSLVSTGSSPRTPVTTAFTVIGVVMLADRAAAMVVVSVIAMSWPRTRTRTAHPNSGLM